MKWELKQEKYIMDSHRYRVVKILFFGAGKKGRYCLDYIRKFGIEPKGMIDNSPELHGSLCEGIMIYSPDILKTLSYEHIFITCNREEEIYKQLIELGVAADKILVGWHNFINHFLYYAMSDILPLNNIIGTVNDVEKGKVLFDLQNGMVLGGVESWTYSTAKVLRDNGYQGLFLVTDEKGPAVIDRTYPAQMLTYEGVTDEKDKIELCVKKIVENIPCTIICNFPFNIFWSACIAKRLYPDSVRIIAVQHSDDLLYYEAYGLWKKAIDKCLVVSSRIEEKLLLFGMEKKKMTRIGWQVSCDKILKRTWSKEAFPVQIGYAGRVTVAQKRVDLLLEAALRLREKNIKFCLNIAGAGNYSEILYQRVKKEKICDYVNIIGYIDRDRIPEFWKEQDIMISCSETEGHSISQTEAMATGAVPVITDVSGARDDVTDGYNGYVVPIGDIDAVVDKISYLYCNRDELELMGKHAHEIVYDRQKDMDQKTFWIMLLNEVWNH